jgi:Tfp pilus assembly protein PilX
MLKDDARRRTKHDERGTALVVSMLLMMVLSVLSASMMFLAQTETASSASYRLMSKARYGAESGVHSAINYLTNTYALPGTPADPLSNYDLTKSPVTNIANNQPVILSSNTAVVASNYPVPAVQTAFNNAVRGTLAAGNQTVS